MIMRYLVGATCARLGDEAAGPALVLLGLAALGTPVTAAAVLAMLTLTTALGGPLLGALLDRMARPGRLLAGALVGYPAGLLALSLLVGRAPVGVLLPVAAATGLLGPALAGGWTARLADLPGVDTTGDRLRRAYSADGASYSAAALFGPALAGGLAALVGARGAVLAAALLPVLAVPVALRLPPPDRRIGHPVDGVVGDLRRGLRTLVARPALRDASLVSALSYLGMGALTVTVPVLAERLTGRPDVGAVLLSVPAVGALAATVLLARRPLPVRPRTQLLASTLVLAAGLSVVAAAGDPTTAAAGLLVVGLADGPQLAALLVIRHRQAPAGLRTQVLVTGASIKLVGFALGAALVGPVAEVSARAGLVAAVAAQVLAFAVGTRRTHRR